MPNVIHVTKPFMFSYPAKEGERLTREKFFNVGDHEVDDEIYAHPYISKHLADGKIESPAQTKVRIEAQLKKVERDNSEGVQATLAANAAFARLKAAEPGAKASQAEIEAELNTPVSQLQTRQGTDVATPVNTLKLKK